MGMTERQYFDEARELIFDFFVSPIIVLVSMFVVGSFIDSFLNAQNTFSLIFTAVGGLLLVVRYYKKKLKKAGF
ncbi:MAG: hypothetical protein V1676_02380 [Candidatus Diapherotrites archaeon]